MVCGLWFSSRELGQRALDLGQDLTEGAGHGGNGKDHADDDQRHDHVDPVGAGEAAAVDVALVKAENDQEVH